MAELRFGVVSESVREGRAWLDYARQIEDTGIDVLLIRDHFSAGAFGPQLAPFTALAAAAAVTTRLRLGTIVLSNDFRHPAIVAHEAASLHLVSGGKVRARPRSRLVPARIRRRRDRVRPGGSAHHPAGGVPGHHQGPAGRHPGPPLRHLVPGGRP